MYNFQIDALFQSVNDIFAQYDSGEITRDEANAILLRCCHAFINNRANHPNLENQNV